jgi:predicted Zn-dependent protease
MKIMKYVLILAFLFMNNICYSATFDECKNLYNNGQYDKSSSCFYSLLSKDKNNAYLKLSYGNSLFAQKRYNEAKVQYTQIIQTNPNSNIAKKAQANLNVTNEKLKNMKTFRSIDEGTYLSDISVVKWSKMPLKVYIQSGKYNASAKNAFIEWQNKTKGNVMFVFVDKPNEAQITVYFKSDISQTSLGDALGVTKVAFNANKTLQRAQIDIKSVTQSGAEQSLKQVYSVTLHEVGHALGIRGHSRNPYDVMYESDDNYRNILSNRDINTIKAIYK